MEEAREARGKATRNIANSTLAGDGENWGGKIGKDILKKIGFEGEKSTRGSRRPGGRKDGQSRSLGPWDQASPKVVSDPLLGFRDIFSPK